MVFPFDLHFSELNKPNCSLLYNTDSPLLCSYIFIALFTLDSSFSSNGDQNCTHHYNPVLTHTCSASIILRKQLQAVWSRWITYPVVWWAPTGAYGVRIWKLKQRIASYSAKKEESTFAHILQGWCKVPERCSKWVAAGEQGNSLSHYLYVSVWGGGRNIRPFYLCILSCPFPLLPINVLFASLSTFLWLIVL